MGGNVEAILHKGGAWAGLRCVPASACALLSSPPAGAALLPLLGWRQRPAGGAAPALLAQGRVPGLGPRAASAGCAPSGAGARLLALAARQACCGAALLGAACPCWRARACCALLAALALPGHCWRLRGPPLGPGRPRPAGLGRCPALLGGARGLWADLLAGS
ncbi:hypothetical protein FNV43_RR12137 [Rhamnella rubrinervis]|uniref:Uncharacterized protein n=1 Tax=Rhamnella rubrinervis TaxID=2594499 RepID=A0A8K0H6V0_9ROSA|nr:hypothetical protein FNV43_RR12137 [Rhamnella rubrinervis]